MMLCLWLCLLSPVLGSMFKDFTDLTYDLESEKIPLFVNTSYQMNVTNSTFLPIRTETVNMSTAVGTHVQAPCRYVSGKNCVSDIPIERLKGHVVILDLPVADQQRDVPITAQQLMDWQKKNGAIKQKAVVIIKTGWGSKWSNASNYLGTNNSAPNNTNMHFPGLSKDAADELIKLNVAAVGIDTASLDYGQSNGSFVVHKSLAEKDIYAILNVANLQNVVSWGVKNTTALVMPMKMKGAGAAPCRFFLVTNGVSSSKSVTSVFVAVGLAVLAVLR